MDCRYRPKEICNFGVINSPGYCTLHGYTHEAHEEISGCLAIILCKYGLAGFRLCEKAPSAEVDKQIRAYRQRYKGR